MNVLVAYSRPKGIYGKYIFTVMIHFTANTEKIEKLDVQREKTTYACQYCGKWASLTTYQSISPKDIERIGTLQIFRYDNVEPHDTIQMYLQDTEMAYWQWTRVYVFLNKVSNATNCYPFRSDLPNDWSPGMDPIYEVTLLDWDAYLQEHHVRASGQRVEERLINWTMKAEEIPIADVRFSLTEQPLQIKATEHFIEGEWQDLS